MYRHTSYPALVLVSDPTFRRSIRTSHLAPEARSHLQLAKTVRHAELCDEVSSISTKRKSLYLVGSKCYSGDVREHATDSQTLLS